MTEPITGSVIFILPKICYRLLFFTRVYCLIDYVSITIQEEHGKRRTKMETTTKIFNGYRDSEIRDLSLEQLSSLYRLTNEQSIIAEAFEQLKRLIVISNNQYPQFDTEDSISFALEKLEMCLLTYVPGSSTKFSTYFIQVYKNKLREESQYLNTHKRCVIYNSTSLNHLMEEGFDVATNKNIDSLTFVLPKTLTPREHQYCQLLAMDYGSNKDIANHMNVSVMTLCNMRKSLRNKLEYLL